MKPGDLQKFSVASVKKLQRYLRKNSLDAFFAADISNVRYLTTFSGTSGFCLVFPDSSYFVTDFRYRTQATHEVVSCDAEVYSANVWDFIGNRFFKRTNGRKLFVGVEDNLPVNTYDEAAAKLSQCLLVKTSQVIEKMAAVKSSAEVERIRRACWISGTALDVLTKEDWIGKTEIELAAALEFNQKTVGGSKESFDTIVASGKRGALPHGVASDKTVERKEFVTLDFGCFYDGYVSDITRTFETSDGIKPELKKIYQIVYDAQRKGIDAARAGVKANKVDKAARDYIRKKGYGKYFGHGLGHGIGLRIHELPKVSILSEDVLEEGNVITIEPGIYVPGLGGVRIEDDFLVTRGGLQQLSHFSKDRDYFSSAHGSQGSS